jgi:hypothetical protein
MVCMCRSIKTLRPPFQEDASQEDFHAAALQYVRKVSGFRTPAPHNADAFDRAVAAVTAATAELMGTLQVRGQSGRATQR